MKVLVIGNGGREHALAWRIAASPQVSAVYVAPGNAGTAHEPKVTNLPIEATDIQGLRATALDLGIDLTVVGPEAPLAAGIVDQFTEAGLACLGPHQAAAELESSKAFAKDFLARHHIPTAAYKTFDMLAPALDYIKQKGAPLVVKADGLAAGKGVTVAMTVDEALDAAQAMFDGAFGQAGARVVVEEWLDGEEASFIALVNGTQYLSLASSQDHKARDAGDQGPNTGGMGAYSPAPVVTKALHQRILDTVIQPTLEGLVAEGRGFTGFLYAGLMIDSQGIPRVLEFNVRLGDPETQPILMRLKSDPIDLFIAALEGRLSSAVVEWDARPALGVVLAAGGYPGDYAKGAVISGLAADTKADAKVFHAGTALDDAGQVITAGGRVLCACALGEDVMAAQKLAYDTASAIHWKGMFMRPDIGYRAVQAQLDEESK